ncbi:MAG: DUF6502 family protein [Limnobacter sp.]|nr:DUF6502 family protein [Limnobacter sp.]
MSDESRADLLLDAALSATEPLIQLLIQEGINYPAFAKALKANFVLAAERALMEKGSKITDSALSVLSGVHRKDLRAWGEKRPHSGTKPLSVIAQAFTRWSISPEYSDADGKPLKLPKSGPAPSFESLIQQITRDIHPRTFLDSMIQLGAVKTEGDYICLSMEAFVPGDSEKDVFALYSDNVRDHIAAGASNLSAKKSRFLEHSVFADEMTEQSAKTLHHSAVELWKDTFQKFALQATELSDQDKDKADANYRLRFGVYFYAEPEQPDMNKDTEL